MIQLVTGTTLCEGHAEFEHIHGMKKTLYEVGKWIVQDQAAQKAWAVKLAYAVTRRL